MKENSSRSTPENSPNFSPPPRKSLTAWTLLLPLLLLAGVIWQGTREPESMNETPAPTSNGGKRDSKKIQRTIFVPDDDGKLEKREVEDVMARNTQFAGLGERAYGFEAERALQLLLRTAPADFPVQTTVRAVTLKGNTARADFSSSFAAPKFWQGSARTLSTIYSIVNTLGAVEPKMQLKQVQILVEGKPVSTLGEFDTSEPIEPDMSLVAKN